LRSNNVLPFSQPRKMNAPGIALLVLLVASSLACADVYKWTDANGRVQYSDGPPRAGKTQQLKIRINSVEGPAVVSQVAGASATKTKGKIRMYSTTWCPTCKKAKAYLAAKGVPYEDVDVEASPRGAQEFAQLGARGVPVILVGSQRMVGFGAARMDEMLAQAGW
jgi:glutaredoxin-like YruB-family protein